LFFAVFVRILYFCATHFCRIFSFDRLEKASTRARARSKNAALKRRAAARTMNVM
jgi:hypothetical protein